MESLALVVSIILLVIMWMGPISIGLSFVMKPWARMLGYITGGLGVVTGIWLASTVDSTGAHVFGALAAALGALGAFLNWRRAYPNRSPKGL